MATATNCKADLESFEIQSCQPNGFRYNVTQKVVVKIKGTNQEVILYR